MHCKKSLKYRAFLKYNVDHPTYYTHIEIIKFLVFISKHVLATSTFKTQQLCNLLKPCMMLLLFSTDNDDFLKDLVSYSPSTNTILLLSWCRGFNSFLSWITIILWKSVYGFLIDSNKILCFNLLETNNWIIKYLFIREFKSLYHIISNFDIVDKIKILSRFNNQSNCYVNILLSSTIKLQVITPGMR